MKAVVAEELCGPSGLAYRDVDDIPDQVDGAVVIDVRAAGVCYPDLLVIRGEYQMKAPAPFIPGSEVAGVVRSAPEDSGLRPGDRVAAGTMHGGYAERIAVSPDSVVHTPAGLDDAQAAALMRNYSTMYFALARRAALRPGETVLVLGAAGGVGSAAVQVAKALGARVIAAVHRTGAVGYVAALGADVVLPLTQGWLSAVREHTGGVGVDVVVDPIGGDVFDDAIRALAAEGRLLVIGFAAGKIPTIKVNRLLLRNVGVLGVGWGEYFLTHPGAEQLFGFGVCQLVAAGMKPPAPVTYPLSKAAEALQLLADGEVVGKLVLEPHRS
ncbi:MAG: NADPH:quinone oxidoreductase family protein [Mycobacteriaceae bacterium]|nr:NADPH:quinone oxidoreductase family protein [Mycobacteriaceae bacterium]